MDLRNAIEQSCDVYFYTVGNMLGVDRINKWATLLRPRREVGHRPARRSARAGAVDARGSGDAQGEVVPRRDDLGGDRPGAGLGDADLAGGHDDDGGQRRHARHAAPPQGDRRGTGLAAGAGARAEVGVADEARVNAVKAVRDGLWMVVNAARHGRPRRIDGRDVAGKTGTAQVISHPGQAARPARRTETCATTAGSCSSRRATIPRSPAWSSPSTASTASTPRRSPSTSSRPTSPRRKASRCRADRRRPSAAACDRDAIPAPRRAHARRGNR